MCLLPQFSCVHYLFFERREILFHRFEILILRSGMALDMLNYYLVLTFSSPIDVLQYLKCFNTKASWLIFLFWRGFTNTHSEAMDCQYHETFISTPSHILVLWQLLSTHPKGFSLLSLINFILDFHIVNKAFLCFLKAGSVYEWIFMMIISSTPWNLFQHFPGAFNNCIIFLLFENK